MKKLPTPNSQPLSPSAVRAFEALPVNAQVGALDVIAIFSKPRIKLTTLLATAAQRKEARDRDAALKAILARRAARQIERIHVAAKLATLHNKAQLRKARRRYPDDDLTPAETKRYNALHARLNAIDSIGGAK